MQFELTPERETYLNKRGKIVLKACPGSGKTTCVVQKLSLLEKDCKKIYGDFSGIACMSFTNRAKDEIIKKYKECYGEQLKFPHLVSTIDSFINQYITLPFFNLLNPKSKRPKITNEESVINTALAITYTHNGKQCDGIQRPFNTFKDRSNKTIYRTYEPGAIWIETDGSYSYKGKCPDPKKIDPQVFQNYGKTLFEWKLKNELITNLDSAWIALEILKKYKEVGNWLSHRFPYILIDEAQDNSSIQHALFEELLSLGLENLELIGDPHQSIYEWRDAKPQLFIEKYTADGWSGLPLSQNRRSVQRIIDCFSRLRSEDDETITSFNVNDDQFPINIYRYNRSNISQVIDHFEAQCIQNNLLRSQIVVRGNSFKDKLLGKEITANPWKEPFPSLLLESKFHFELHEIKEAINSLRKHLCKLIHAKESYSKLRELENEYAQNIEFNAKLYTTLHEIPPSTLSFEEWSGKSISIISSQFGFDPTPSFTFKTKMNGFKMVDLKKDLVCNHFFKPSSKTRNIPITTVHQIKGATLDALLFFFDENSSAQSISFGDFKSSERFPPEKQRIIYVACSRPSQLLALACPENISEEKLLQQFGKGISIHHLS
jgi:DNA helicase II / ATP-dependent DNA helicase PcrA